MKFYSVFAALSFLLFLPYLGMIASFFTNYFLPNPTATGAVTNPIDSPLGFGLTYWSVYLLNRLIKLTVTSTFISVMSIVSIGLVTAALFLVYWRTSKLSFQKPAYDLAFIMLLPLFAFFLT